MSLLDDISLFLQQGRGNKVKETVEEAINEGMDPIEILNGGLLAGMGIIGDRFKKNEVYVPEVLMAARAMYAGMDILKPILTETGVESIGKVVIGTVKGDHHDIGKNLVKMMMEGKGLEVIDLGINVSAEKFVESAQEYGAQIIACSALLTTTMVEMEKVVEVAKEAGIREHVTIMVGGAPVTGDFCSSIGADIYTPDAASAAEEAAKVCQKLK